MSDTSRTEVRPEYVALARSLREVLAAEHGLPSLARAVVGVAGESGSGKSATAASLARELTATGMPAVVLHQDDFFRLPPRANHAARERDIGHVGPGEVNLPLLAATIAAFRAGRDGVEAPTVDYAADRFVMRRLDFAAARALVVEGTYVLQLEDLDVRIFLEATHEDTRARRRTRARDVDSPFVERVLEIEHAIIARQRAVADVVIDREFAVRRG